MVTQEVVIMVALAVADTAEAEVDTTEAEAGTEVVVVMADTMEDAKKHSQKKP
jgi:hypothetical protein